MATETINADQLGDWARKLGDELGHLDFRPAMAELASDLIQETTDHFRSGVDPDRTPWLPRKKDGGRPFSGGSILRGLVTDVDSHTLFYGTSAFVARLGHHGSKHQINRPLIGFSEQFIASADQKIGAFVERHIAAGS